MEETAITPGKLHGLRRMADQSGHFTMLAVDQRPPIKDPIATYYGTSSPPYQDVARFKSLLVQTLQSHASALLLDPHYCVPDALAVLNPTRGLIVTLENSVFDSIKEGGRISSSIDSWSVGQIKRMGGDAVKLLVWYRPDAPESIREAQQEFTAEVGRECCRLDLPFLLELLLYPLPHDAEQTTDYTDMSTKKTDLVLASVEEFARPRYAVDVFKLESPVSVQAIPLDDSAPESPSVAQAFADMGRIANRPWVMLSAGASATQFERVLTYAYNAGSSGYLAGRAIWLEAFRHFPNWINIESSLKTQGLATMSRYNELTKANATPWQHWFTGSSIEPTLNSHEGDFRLGYTGL